MLRNVLIAVVSAILSTSALASTTKVYSGCFCQGDHEGQSPFQNTVIGCMRDNGGSSTYISTNYSLAASSSNANYQVADCPAELPAAAEAITSVTINATDNDGNSGSGHGMYCYVAAFSYAGGLYATSAKWVCGTAGGCTSDPGTGTWASTITWTNPVNSGNTITNVDNLLVYCEIPGSTNGGGVYYYSGVTSYSITSNP